MNAYELPTALEVNGNTYEIRSDFRAVLDVLAAQNDPELDDQSKAYVLLTIMYPDFQSIPRDDVEEALKKAIEFIDYGYEDDGSPKPRLVDWQQDASMIISGINKVAHTEVRQLQYMHWWTFFSYYMEIGDGLFSEVVSIRSKKAKHKKLEKYEQEFYRNNKAIVDLKTPETEEAKAQKNSILEYLNRKEGGEKK